MIGKVNPVSLERINRRSVPTTETSLALVAVYFAGKYTWELAQVKIWRTRMVPTVGPETYLEGPVLGISHKQPERQEHSPSDQQMGCPKLY